MLRFVFTLLANSDRKTLTDEEVVAQYLSTQKNYYFEILYNRYSSKIFGKCLTILKETNLAQDATQDIMMKILMNLSKFGGRSKFSTWVYSITYNFCIDYVRKKKKDKSMLVEDVSKFEGATDDVDDSKILEVRLSNLKVVMAKMPIGDQSVLMMKYLDGMSIKEISDTLAKSESAIKMKLKRAKHRFVKIHQEANIESY